MLLDQKDLIFHNQRFIPPPKLEPKIDEVVSKIVGKKIYQLDPRLMKLVVKWKGSKPEDSKKPDNFFKDENKIKELKKVLGGSL